MSTAQTQEIRPIEPVEVVRREDGWWYHPQWLTEPEFEDVEYIPVGVFEAYTKARGITTTVTSLEGDDAELYEAYFVNEDFEPGRWIPTPPEGDGWFVLSIQDHEDGPTCVWGRKIPAVEQLDEEAQLLAGELGK